MADPRERLPNDWVTPQDDKPDDWVTPPTTTAETAANFGMGTLRGFNETAANVLMAPLRASAWLTGTQGRGFEGMAERALDPYLNQPTPQTEAERYGRGVGSAVAAATPVTGGFLGFGPRLAAMTPTNVVQGVGQTIGSYFARSPTAAVAADAAAAAGSGLGQQFAAESGFGPTGQIIGGVAGGFAPFAPGAVVGGVRHAIAGARANSDPHARVANTLGEQSIDELRSASATGHTGIDEPLARRVMTTLGEEMVAAGGDRVAAVNNTLRRLEVEGGVTAQTAREQLRRVTGAQADSELMLAEYPVVAQSNLDTRGLQHSPEAVQAAELLGVDALQNTTRAGTRANINRLVQEFGVTRNVARNRLTAARGILEDEQAAGALRDVQTHHLLDYIANSAGDVSTPMVQNAIMERLPHLRDHARGILRNMSPNQQTIEDSENLILAMTRLARQEYNAIHNAPPGSGTVNYNMLHGLLPRVVERHLGRMRGRSGDQADELRKAIDQLYVDRPTPAGQQMTMDPNLPHMPATLPRMSPDQIPQMQDEVANIRAAIREARRQRLPREEINDLTRMADGMAEALRLARRDVSGTDRALTPSLQQLQDMRGQIRGQITSAIQSGRNDIAATLQPLYDDLTRVMERSSPQWRTANRRWADMNIGQRAQELGDAFANAPGPQYRQQIAEFRALAPDAQDLVRIHFVQKLLDKLAGPETHDLAKLFATGHMRNAVRTILGDEAAMNLSRFIRDMKVVTKSRGMTAGSQTHRRGMMQGEQDADLGILASVDNANTGGFRQFLLNKTINILRERRNRPLAKILTTPMRDTAGVAEHLERMRIARERAGQAAFRVPEYRGQVGRYGSMTAPVLPDGDQ
jgi:hypothetical protein